MKILVLTNLYPPHHAGTFDFRCQQMTENLERRGHEIRILASNHGLNTEQRDAQIERRLWLSGVYGHAAFERLGDLTRLERHNHAVLQEALSAFAPELAHVYSLHGLSKALVVSLRRARVPTAFDVADYWLADELRQDPWLRWWNRPGFVPVRSLLEWTGRRRRLDAGAPTRPIHGVDRLPEVFGKAVESPAPNSITAFRLERICFCSRWLKDRTERAGYKVDQGEVIYPPIATERLFAEVRPPSAAISRLLIVGDLRPESGALTALAALEQLRQEKMKLTLSICGRGESEYVAQLRSRAVRLQLPVEFITVSNLASDLAGVYRRHDLFLHTVEVDEPFAPGPLEAMAAGLPVVGTVLGGSRELLRPGENALTYTAGDSAELAARIKELAADPAGRVRLAETGQREVLSRFNETAVTDQLENFLLESRQFWQMV